MPHIWICQSRPWGLRRWSLKNPPSIQSCWSWRWAWSAWGNPPSPLGKVTSGSSPLGLLLPEGSPQGVGWGLLGGVCSLQSATSVRDPPWVDAALGLQGHKLCLEATWSASTQVRVTSRWMRVTLPLWGQRSQFRRVTSHYGNICLYVRLLRSNDLNGNWFISQFCCLYSTAWCLLHLFCHAKELLTLLPNTRAHPRGECAPVSHIIPWCPPLTQKWHQAECHLSSLL